MGKLDVTRLPVEQIRLRLQVASFKIAHARTAARRRRAWFDIRRLVDEMQRRRELLGSEESALDA